MRQRLTPEERLDLKLSYVTLRRELNEAEALNMLVGERWALSRKRDALDEVFLRAALAPSCGRAYTVGSDRVRSSATTSSA